MEDNIKDLDAWLHMSLSRMEEREKARLIIRHYFGLATPSPELTDAFLSWLWGREYDEVDEIKDEALYEYFFKAE